MSIIHVNHIKANCQSRFSTLIDMSDVNTLKPDDREVHFLSRALAAFSISALAKVDDLVAASSVVDESLDDGIDAFFFDSSERVCYLVQSKWAKDGNGTIDLGSVLKFTQGVNHFFEDTSKLGPKMQARKHEIDGLLGDSRTTFVLVVSYTGRQDLSTEARKPLDELLIKLNEDEPWVSLQILKQKEIHQVVEQLALGHSVDLTVLLNDYGVIREPYKAYYGQVDVADIAPWGRFGDQLYYKNIRWFKGNTDVNDAIAETLRDGPENFLYFNNGVTLLCSELKKQPLSGSGRNSGVFECKGASVVNGAQTVGSIISTAATLGNARVMVRLISLEKCPAGFASDITRATNTQNRIEKRDFAALDKEQSRLKSDMLLSLSKEYVFRTGDLAPKPENGCTLDEATVALACAQAEITYSMTAKREVSKLYDDITQPPYTVLFNGSLGALRLWRSVEVTRSVDEVLKKVQSITEGKNRLIAIHGNRFILYLVFRLMDQGILDQDDGVNGASMSALIPGVTEKVLAKTIERASVLYPNAYPSNLFKNVTKCKALADDVKGEMAEDSQPRQ